MHALYVVVPVLCILAIAYRYYSAFIATRIWMLDDARVDAGPYQVRRRQLLPHQPLGPVRPPLRGHHRSRTAGRSDAGGAVRLRARPDLAAWPECAGRRRPRLDDPVGVDPPGRPVAGRHRPARRSARSPASSPPSRCSSSWSSPSPASASTWSTPWPTAAWGTFTIAMTIPIGIFMGFWMYVWRKGRITEATIIGVIGLLLAVVRRRAAQPLRSRGSAASSTCRAPGS